MLKAGYSDKTLILDILTESFDSNKSINFVIKQDKRRKERIRHLMDYSFELCHAYGEILLSTDKNACALLLYPDLKRTTFKSILLDIKVAFKSIGISRISKILKRDASIKSNYPNEAMVYLWFIGVKNKDQQRGIGSQLIQHIIQKSESSNRAIYLETSMPENLKFYHKHGFEIYKELLEPYPLYLIRRNSSNERH